VSKALPGLICPKKDGPMLLKNEICSDEVVDPTATTLVLEESAGDPTVEQEDPEFPFEKTPMIPASLQTATTSS